MPEPVVINLVSDNDDSLTNTLSDAENEICYITLLRFFSL